MIDRIGTYASPLDLYLVLGQRKDSRRADLAQQIERLKLEQDQIKSRPGIVDGLSAARSGIVGEPSRNPPNAGRNCSAVTNGSRLLEAGDNRGPWARRMREVVELHISDLGGLENASEDEKSIIARAAALTVEAERLEAKFSTLPNGPRAEDLDLYQRCSNSLRRLLESIGIQRRPRDVTPSLQTYLASRKSRQGAEEGDQ